MTLAKFLALTTQFIGRESELQKLDDWYNSGVPLASIVGLPGTGKTYLVQEWCKCKGCAEDISIWTVDSGYGFLPQKATPRDYAQNLLRRIGYELGVEIDDDIEVPATALASKARQSGGILVLDQLESALSVSRKIGGVEVGDPDENLLRFINAFVSMSRGTGRIILVSSVRPRGVADPHSIDSGKVKPIFGGQTRVPLQLGGFSRDDAIQFARASLRDDRDLPSEKTLLGAIDLLQGHPKALKLFSA